MKTIKLLLPFCFLIMLNGAISGQGYYADIDDIKMYYEVYGEGEPIMLIHGGMGDAEHFKHLIPELSKKYKLIVPNCRTHGRTNTSDKLLSYHLMATDMIELMDHLKIESAGVIGWSMGGAIAMDMAINQPERISEMVVIGTYFRQEAFPAGMKEMILSLTPGSFPPEAVERYNRISPIEGGAVTYAEKMKDFMLKVVDGDIFTEEQVKSISCPTLIMAGDLEGPGVLNDVMKMHELISDSQLSILPDATHFLVLTHPVLVNLIVSEYLDAPKVSALNQ